MENKSNGEKIVLAIVSIIIIIVICYVIYTVFSSNKSFYENSSTSQNIDNSDLKHFLIYKMDVSIKNA